MRPKENRLSYWFPLLKGAGIPVPATEIVEMSKEAQKEIWEAFDGSPPGAAYDAFIAKLTEVSEKFSAPFFLRADETSAKHYWKDTCFVEDNTKLSTHVMNIAEFCATVDLFGLPFDTWAIREMLPTKPAFHAFRGEMPVTEEWRAFVQGGNVLCVHPYWPKEAILYPSVEDWAERMTALYPTVPPVTVVELAGFTGMALGTDAWSVDVLATTRGYYVIDVALASISWHDDSCGHAETLKEQRRL